MRKIKWGVLGTADIARGQTIPGMKLAANCELYAIAGRRMEKAEQFKNAFGFAKAYEGYDALLSDPEVEAVYIPLPNDLHAEWSIRALRAGKHVLCEKPMAPSESEAERMFRAAEESGVFLMEAFAYLHSPAVAALKQEMDNGAVGGVRFIDSAFITGRRPDTDIRLKRENYGGAQYDLGCYPVSMILWLAGREPMDVRAAAHFSPGRVDLETSAILQFDNDMAAGADCGMIPGIGRLDRFHVMGTEGEIHSALEFNQCGTVRYTICRGGESETKMIVVPNNYQLEVEQLGRCITEGETPHVPKEFSLRVARTTDRILRAAGY